MSRSTITGKVAVLPSVEWMVPQQNCSIFNSANQLFYLSNHEIRSPVFHYEDNSLHIRLNIRNGLFNIGQSCRHFRLCILDGTGKEILSNSESKRVIHISKAKIVIRGNTYNFHKEGDVHILPSSNLGYNYVHEAVNIVVELGRQEPTSESKTSLSKIPGKCKRPSILCGACEYAGKRFIDLSQNFKNMYLNKLECDLTINVKKEKFEVHKSIMAARSPVFLAMMKHDMAEKKSNSVDVTDCDPEAFGVFLIYLYSGEAEKLSTENVLGVYVVADKYDVDALKADCVVYMKANLCVDQFCDIIELAAKYNESDLLKVAKQFFAKNAKKIFQAVKWQLLMKKNTTLANELLFLLV